MSEEDKPAKKTEQKDEMAALREKAQRFGTGYAVMSEAFASKGMTALTRYVGWFIIGMAALVVVLAVASKF